MLVIRYCGKSLVLRKVYGSKPMSSLYMVYILQRLNLVCSSWGTFSSIPKSTWPYGRFHVAPFDWPTWSPIIGPRYDPWPHHVDLPCHVMLTRPPHVFHVSCTKATCHPFSGAMWTVRPTMSFVRMPHGKILLVQWMLKKSNSG
jgi:hypothetical protein